MNPLERIRSALRGPAARPAIRVRLDDGAYLPERAHDTDAGADIRTPVDVVVPACRWATVHTGVHVELPPNTVGMLKSKSGLNVRHHVIGEGVIDQGYDGEVVVKPYNLGGEHVQLLKGSKIIQLVVMPVTYPKYVKATRITGGERGNRGFGSTGA